MNFVNLHNHTNFSILQALPSPKELFQRASELKQSALALTDNGTLAGVWDSYKAAKSTGVKLIVGLECHFLPDSSNKEERLRHLVLLAQNATGYKNLLSLNRRGFDSPVLAGRKVLSVADWKSLEQFSEGLTCLTGSGNGIIGYHLNNKDFGAAETDLKRLIDIFSIDNLGAEVQPHRMDRPGNHYYNAVNQVFTNHHLINLANKLGVRVVPTSNAYYLRKEDHQVHDVLLAVGAMQPVYSNARLRFNTPDFYLKTYEEVKAFFTRDYTEEFASQICDNTLYFADKSSNPEWVELKYSNPEGKELPVFNVTEVNDYNQFKQWWKAQPTELQNLSIDSAYLRFKCFEIFEVKFKHKLSLLKQKEYINRIEEELSVLDHQGFSSYLLIVSDYVNWARNQGILDSPGRGCLIGNTLILTDNGFKELKNISVGDKVYSHTGKLRKVLSTFKFPVNETLLQIKNQFSFETLSMTKDHKIYTSFVERGSGVQTKLSFVEIGKLTKKNYLFFPKLDRPLTNQYQDIDLSKYIITGLSADGKYEVHNNIILISKSSKNEFAIRKIYRETGISRRAIKHLKNNGIMPLTKDGKRNTAHLNNVKVINNYLSRFHISVNDWIELNNVNVSSISRFIKFDKELIYIIGRWVGDGWLKDHGSYHLGIAFHSEDNSIFSIEAYFNKLGYKTYTNISSTKKLKQLYIWSELLPRLFRELFPDYKDTSGTKHLPLGFRTLTDDLLRELLLGLSHSNGSVDKTMYPRDNIDTTSKRLMLECKEALQYLNIASSVMVRKPFYRGKYLCNTAFKLRFKGLNVPKKYDIKHTENGTYGRVLSIVETTADYVYDITVEEDHSYLTSNGIVHNSVGGVLIAYLLGIHKADPIKYNLIFARFQNREKLSPPDIDQDFPTSARDKVINYIQQKYGNDKVAFISNFSRITPKVYARDIARSLEFGNDRKKAVEIGDAIADAIPKELKNSASFEDLKGSPLFYEYVNTYPKLAENAHILGSIRNYSLHAAALVIGRRSLSGLVPLRTDKDGNQALEYEKNNAEDIGLLKVDILGLSTLDLIESTINLVNKHQNTMLCMDDIKFEDYDKKTYDLITAGDTFGVFQLGTSGGTIDLCKKVKPRSIQDLAIITTLARPAAAAIREVFIKARENKKNVELLHPSLENSFGKTYGFCLYDETYLQLGQDVAGWNLNQSDRIRKMIKDKGKNPEKDQKLRAEFIDSAANKINRDIATKIWDQHVSSAASYTFNLSHAILYSFTSFITAYLKAHYPTEFLLANLMADVRSNAPNAEENVNRAKLELRHRGVKILPPDLNKSEMGYHLLDDRTLLTGLDALKFVGDDAIEDILAKRPFHSFEDFMRRVDTRKVRSSTIQALAAVGCLDIFHLSRRSIYQYCVDYRKKLGVWVKKKNDETFSYPWNDQVEWTPSELFALEKQYLGESFVCSKKDAFGKFFKVEHANVLAIKNGEKKQHISNVRAEIKSVFALTVKKEGSAWLGHQMAKLTIEDVNGVQCGLTIFPEQWAQLQRDLKANKKLAFEPGYAIKINGTCNLYENEMGFVMENLTGLEPPPALPKDLKIKKIAMASSPLPVGTGAPGEFEQSLEDQLFNEGLIDLDDAEDSPT